MTDFLKTWHDILDQVHTLEHDINISASPTREIYYRGQPDSSFKLIPALSRLRFKCDTPALAENNLYHDFIHLGGHMLPRDATPLEILSIMQYHGVPTRLLDWTTSFCTALFFAISKWNYEEAPSVTVWMVSPYDLNRYTNKGYADIQNLRTVQFPYDTFLMYERVKEEKELIKNDGPEVRKIARQQIEVFEKRLATAEDDIKVIKSWPSVLAISGSTQYERMRAQAGVFTFHKDISTPLEEIYDNVKRIDIPAEAIPLAKEFLRINGVNEYRLFPDLDGLAEILKQSVNYVPFVPLFIRRGGSAVPM